MGFPTKLLGPDEEIFVSTRTHVKVMFVPALILIAVTGAAAFLSAKSSEVGDGSATTALRILIAVTAILLVLWFSVKPFLHWITTTYTVTNRRLITRTGILTRRGHDIPLARISDVASERHLSDRLLRCGTLVFADASEQRVKLHDIPRVEEVQLIISSLLHGDVAQEREDPALRRMDDGT